MRLRANIASAWRLLVLRQVCIGVASTGSAHSDDRVAAQAVVGAAAWRTSLPATMQKLLFIESCRTR
jgi:hypothetical protein